MEIREIRVRNIRSFEKGAVKLGSGTSLLWGDVGAGKTSLLHAIEMALFGFSEVDPAQLIRHGATTAEVALTLSDENHEYVFTRRFHRRMRRGRDLFETDEKGTGLSTDGVMTRYPATELRQRAIDLLGFPDNPNPRAHSDLWRWAVYVPQERMRQILEGDDAESRLETVRKALGLERYRAAAENAKVVAHEFRRDSTSQVEQADLLQHWESDLLEGEAALRNAERARQEALESETAGRRSIADATVKLEAADAVARRLEADRRESAEVTARIEESDLRLGSRSQRLAEATRRERSLIDEIGRLDAIASTLSGLSERSATAGRSVNELTMAMEASQASQREVDVAGARRQAVNDRIRDDEARLARAIAERDRLSDTLAKLAVDSSQIGPTDPAARPLTEIESAMASAMADSETRASELHRWEGVLTETDDLIARGVCPRCGQTVTPASFESHRAEARDALDTARQAYQVSSSHRSLLIAERSAWEDGERRRLARASIEERERAARMDEGRALSEIARVHQELATRRPELAEIDAILAKAEPPARERDRLTERVRAAVSEHQRLLAELAEAERARHEVQLRRESLGSTQQEIEGIRADDSGDRTRSQGLRERLAVLVRAIEESGPIDVERRRLSATLERERAALEATVGRLHRADGDAESARRRVAEAQTRVQERLRLRSAARELRALAEFLTGPFRDAMLELEHRLLARAKVEFDRSFGRYFAALIEDPTFVARSGPRFDPSVEIDGEFTPPEALSGGERTALALAFRLALADVVRSLDRLDLSTLILDEPTDGFSPEQVQRMGELLTELDLPQVVLVSHEVALNGIADRVIQIRKVNGSSEIVEEKTVVESDTAVGLQE